jgi:hypothetical protein
MYLKPIKKQYYIIYIFNSHGWAIVSSDNSGRGIVWVVKRMGGELSGLIKEREGNCPP